MDRFLEMRTFAAVVDTGSFVGAADALDMSKPAVSRYVNELEARLGVRLLQRTTRRLSLTSEGEVFHARCKELLAQVDEAEAEVSSSSAEVTGLLKLSVPVTFGERHLAPLWPQFMARHPKVALDVSLSDRAVDLVEEGFDLAIRIAQPQSSSLVSRRLATSRLYLCASPEYLARHGTPSHPDDLAHHTILAYTLLATGEHWTFHGPEGEIKISVSPRFRSNSGDTCRSGALAHQGVILQPDFLVGPDIAAGRLVELMPQYQSTTFGIYALYPSRKHVTPKVRRLIEFLAESLQAPDWSGQAT